MPLLLRRASMRRVVLAISVTASVVASLASFTPAAQGAPEAAADVITSCVSTTAWQNPAHTSAGCELASRQIAAQWTARLNGQTSYPVLASGKVFVTTHGDSHSPYGGYVYALSGATGRVLWGPLRVEGTYYSYNLSYLQGRLFVTDFDGTVRAFDANTGAALWQTETEPDAGLPVAFAGALFLETEGSVYKLEAKTGRVLWSVHLQVDGSLAVTDHGVYANSTCARYRLSLLTGQPVWATVANCTGGPSGVTYAADGRVFDSIGHRVYSGTSGAQIGEYFGQPAFSGGVAYDEVESRVAAVSLATGAQRWVRDLPEGVSAPVVAAGTVWTASAGHGGAVGHLYGLSTRDGSISRVIKLPTGAPQNFDASVAVGQGRLVVTVANTVTAYA